MYETKIIRKVDEIGRTVIPKKLRQEKRIEDGDLIEIYVRGDSIVLIKHVPRCIFCRSEIGIRVFKDKFICHECLIDIKLIN
ncbi:MAG: AbrB/MazE/SpoVT family DNA-binding domain-containing protein [Acetivibrionales bacterium]|jgi:transcriptional pleiotropic regulator of transition state genes|nr:AbrB family transcriptional regulator [Clostridiaceae bacterium]